MLPKFDTTIEDIDSQAAACTVFTDFIESFRREDLFRAAEAYVRGRAPNASAYSFVHAEGGLMGLVMGMMVMGSTGSQSAEHGLWLDRKLMEHYEFTKESIPPRMLVREALATQVRLDGILADLSRMASVDGRATDWAARLRPVAAGISSPEDAYTMDDARIDEIIHNC
jgi:hypothetical protein